MRTTIVAMLAATMLSPLALAQDGQRPRRPQGVMERSPEDAAKIWTAHATAAAKHLELNGEQTSQFVKAYVAARESMREASREARRAMRDGQGERPGRGERAERGERPAPGDRADDRPRARRGEFGQRGGAGREAMMKLADAERAKLKSSLATFLDDATLDRAMTTIGNLNGRADRMISAVLSLELESGKNDQALSAVLGYIAAQPTRADMAELDRQGMRDAMRDARESFMAEMQSILSEDELKAFRATQQRRGPRDGAGRGGRGQRGEREFELPPI